MTQPSRIDGLPDLPKPAYKKGDGDCTIKECAIADFFTADQMNAHYLKGYEAGSAAAAQAAKQVPAGFVLVPREPTRAMWLAAEKLLKGPNNAYRIWEDMIAAAPSATSLAEAAEAGQVEASGIDYAHTLLPQQLRSWASAAEDYSETIPVLMRAAADALAATPALQEKKQ